MLIGEIRDRMASIVHEAEEKLIVLGKECAVLLSGFDEDASHIENVGDALSVIVTALETERSATRVLNQSIGRENNYEHSAD